MNSPGYNKFDTPPEGLLIRGLDGKWRRGDDKPLTEWDLRIIAGEDPIKAYIDIQNRKAAERLAAQKKAADEADAAKALLAEAKTPEESALAAQMVAETRIQPSP